MSADHTKDELYITGFRLLSAYSQRQHKHLKAVWDFLQSFCKTKIFAIRFLTCS